MFSFFFLPGDHCQASLSQNTSSSHRSNVLLSRHKSWCMVEVVAGSVSHRSSLLDFTLAGDLVTQQVARVQIETYSAFLHSWHPESSIQEQRLFLYCRINCGSSFFYCTQMGKVQVSLYSPSFFSEISDFYWNSLWSCSFMSKNPPV